MKHPTDPSDAPHEPGASKFGYGNATLARVGKAPEPPVADAADPPGLTLDADDAALLFPLLMDLFIAIGERRNTSPMGRIAFGGRVTQTHRRAARCISEIGDKHGK